MLHAGKLKHRVDIQTRSDVRNEETGASIPTWVSIAENVFAGIEPLSVREFLSASSSQSEVTARITIRYRPGIDATLRLIGKTRPYTGKIFNIHGVLNDKDSGAEYLTLPVSEGVNDGE